MNRLWARISIRAARAARFLPMGVGILAAAVVALGIALLLAGLVATAVASISTGSRDIDGGSNRVGAGAAAALLGIPFLRHELALRPARRGWVSCSSVNLT